MVKLKKESKIPKRNLYKMGLFLLKVTPFIAGFSTFIYNILYYFKITPYILDFGFGVSFIMLLYLYINSYMFKFCEYHRIPLYYLFINFVVLLYDYIFLIPISVYGLFILNFIIGGIAIIITTYLYIKYEQNNKKSIRKNNR